VTPGGGGNAGGSNGDRLVVSPYVLGFSGVVSPFWNHLIVGVLVGALAIWATVTPSDGACVKT
jgi:hypothetical protein